MNYTDTRIQTAIDAAFDKSPTSPLTCVRGYSKAWNREAPTRLAIARAFLAALSKPWTLPAPPPGQKWHREDWTQEMLPDGYRPLLNDEPWLHGDEILRYDEWHIAGQNDDDAIGAPTTEFKCHCRTRRPLQAPSAEPPKAQEAEQTKPDEKPCGLNSALEAWPAPAQPTQSPQDWTPKPGDVVRLKSGGPKMAVDTVAEPDEHREGQLVYGCFWIAEDGRPQAFKLPAVLLQPAD